MSAAPLAFHLSHVRVELEGPASIVEIARAVWGGCAELVRPAQEDAYDVHENGRGGYEIRRNGELVTWTEYELDVIPRLEALFYERVHATRPAETLFLHGAALLHQGRPLLLVGPSGAGKSTLSLAAVRAGLGYLSDELIAIDRERVWGMPRAIQFDAIAEGAPVPAWLEAIDLSTFRIRHDAGGTGVIPIFRAEAAPVSAPIGGSWVVMIERGEADTIERRASVEGVRALYEAAHGPPPSDLGTVVGAGGTFALTWRDPAAAIAKLVDAL